MLLLLFCAGGQEYGIPARSVAEVLPVPELRTLPMAPAWAAGTFRYRGTVVPVVDTTALLAGAPSRSCMSTRVALVSFRDRLLGLMAEDMMETLPCAESDFQPAGVRVDGAPFLGDLVATGGRDVQRITVERLLPPEVQERLFADND